MNAKFEDRKFASRSSLFSSALLVVSWRDIDCDADYRSFGKKASDCGLVGCSRRQSTESGAAAESPMFARRLGVWTSVHFTAPVGGFF